MGIYVDNYFMGLLLKKKKKNRTRKLDEIKKKVLEGKLFTGYYWIGRYSWLSRTYLLCVRKNFTHVTLKIMKAQQFWQSQESCVLLQIPAKHQLCQQEQVSEML